MDDDCMICRAQRGEMVEPSEGWQDLGLKGARVIAVSTKPVLTFTLSTGEAVALAGMVLVGSERGAVPVLGSRVSPDNFAAFVGLTLTIAALAEDGSRLYRFGEHVQLVVPQQIFPAAGAALVNHEARSAKKPKSRYRFS